MNWFTRRWRWRRRNKTEAQSGWTQDDLDYLAQLEQRDETSRDDDDDDKKK
jgi:hypothetical protein